MKRRLSLAFGAACAVAAGARARRLGADDGRDETVRLVCPAAAGGSIDFGARLVAARLATQLGQPFVIENRPGAGTTLGALAVARAAPDGRTLLLTAMPVFALGPQLYRSARYDPERDYTVLGAIGRSAPFLVVAAGARWPDLAALVADARAHPRQLTMAHFGSGGASHLPAVLLQRQAAIETVAIPYRSEAESYPDLLAGRVDASFYYGPTAVPQVQAGRLRALACADRHRSNALPQVPTLAEAGFAGAEFEIEWLLLGPAGLPAARAARLAAALAAVAADPDLHAAFAARGAELQWRAADAALAWIASERQAKGRLLRELGLHPQ